MRSDKSLHRGVPVARSSHPDDLAALLPLPESRITDTAGRGARIVSVRQAGPEPTALIRIERGPEVVLAVSLLSRQRDGSYRLPFAFGISPATPRTASPAIPDRSNARTDRAGADSAGPEFNALFAREQAANPAPMQDERVPISGAQGCDGAGESASYGSSPHN
jgi:hypothetical protein